jgi:hypothetical protein
MEIRHGKTNLLVWLEATRRGEHLLHYIRKSKSEIAVVSAKKAYLDARRLEWIFRRENQYPMVFSVSKRRIRRATLENKRVGQ